MTPFIDGLEHDEGVNQTRDHRAQEDCNKCGSERLSHSQAMQGFYA
jgi:hypothetical protein